jgi:hypothetical protein
MACCIFAVFLLILGLVDGVLFEGFYLKIHVIIGRLHMWRQQSNGAGGRRNGGQRSGGGRRLNLMKIKRSWRNSRPKIPSSLFVI